MAESFIGYILIFNLDQYCQERESIWQVAGSGCSGLDVGQAFINIAAITGLIPLTGLPLPFKFRQFSVSILAGLGIAVNVAKYS